MEETVISWTAPNILTVFLMALIGYAAIGFAIKAFVSVRGGSDKND